MTAPFIIPDIVSREEDETEVLFPWMIRLVRPPVGVVEWHPVSPLPHALNQVRANVVSPYIPCNMKRQ